MFNAQSIAKVISGRQINSKKATGCTCIVGLVLPIRRSPEVGDERAAEIGGQRFAVTQLKGQVLVRLVEDRVPMCRHELHPDVARKCLQKLLSGKPPDKVRPELTVTSTPITFTAGRRKKTEGRKRRGKKEEFSK